MRRRSPGPFEEQLNIELAISHSQARSFLKTVAHLACDISSHHGRFAYYLNLAIRQLEDIQACRALLREVSPTEELNRRWTRIWHRATELDTATVQLDMEGAL